MFKIFGALVALYTLHAVVTGRVFAKSGPGGRWIVKGEEPRYYWVVIAIYAGLSAALITVF